MLTLIGLTLVFAGLTSALGVPRASRTWRSNRTNLVALLPLVTHLVMAVWFLAAGAWALMARACIG